MKPPKYIYCEIGKCLCRFTFVCKKPCVPIVEQPKPLPELKLIPVFKLEFKFNPLLLKDDEEVEEENREAEVS